VYYIKHRRKINAKARLTIILIIVTITVIMTNAFIRDIMGSSARIQAQNMFTESLSESMDELMANEHSFNLTNVKTNETGEIVSIQTDTAGINRLKAQVSELMVQKLGEMERHPVTVTIGSLTGIELLAGLGPQIELRFELRGGIKTDIVSEFTETGINQSLHRINCVVSADYYIILPGHRFEANLSSTVPLAESVIVGKVPDAYTYVVGDQSDTIGRIFDYAQLEP